MEAEKPRIRVPINPGYIFIKGVGEIPRSLMEGDFILTDAMRGPMRVGYNEEGMVHLIGREDENTILSITVEGSHIHRVLNSSTFVLREPHNVYRCTEENEALYHLYSKQLRRAEL